MLRPKNEPRHWYSYMVRVFVHRRAHSSGGWIQTRIKVPQFRASEDGNDLVDPSIPDLFDVLATAPLVALVLLVAFVKPGEGSDAPRVPQQKQAATPATQACAVFDFSVYRFNEDGYPGEFPSSTLDLTDGKITIVADVYPDHCKPKCVKISLAGHVKKERVAPYALYGDLAGQPKSGAPRQSGQQKLEACLYSDRDCTVNKHGCLSRTIDVIPINEPLAAGPYEMAPFSVTFNNVDPTTVSANDTKVAAATICQTIEEYWGFGAFYRCDVGVSSFKCAGILVSGSKDALTIKFKTVISVNKETGSNPYCNRRIPNRKELFSSMTSLLQNNDKLGPGGIYGSFDYFVHMLQSDYPRNPYRAATSLTVTV